MRQGKAGKCTLVTMVTVAMYIHSFHGSLQRHCIVVTNRDTYPGACEQSSKHSGKTATQLAKELGEVRVNYRRDRLLYMFVNFSQS